MVMVGRGGGGEKKVGEKVGWRGGEGGSGHLVMRNGELSRVTSTLELFGSVERDSLGFSLMKNSLESHVQSLGSKQLSRRPDVGPAVKILQDPRHSWMHVS